MSRRHRYIIWRHKCIIWRHKCIIWKLSSIIWKLSSIIWRLSSIIWRLSSIIWRLSSIIWRLSSIIWRLSSIIWRLSSIIWRLSSTLSTFMLIYWVSIQQLSLLNLIFMWKRYLNQDLRNLKDFVNLHARNPLNTEGTLIKNSIARIAGEYYYKNDLFKINRLPPNPQGQGWLVLKRCRAP